MSAKGQKRTSVRLLNQLVPPAQAKRRYSQVECFLRSDLDELFAAVLCSTWTRGCAIAFACVGNTPDGAARIIGD
jgi:hypothetical protein